MEHEAFKGVIIVKDGVQKRVSFEELCISNTMSLEALVSLLVKKKIVKPEELLDAIKSTKGERYRTGLPPDGDQPT